MWRAEPREKQQTASPRKNKKQKQTDPISIVSQLCHIINSALPNRKRIALTLGSNSSPIDDVRSIVNTSTGETGWAISELLHRMGHDVICVAGLTSVSPRFKLPDVRNCSSPDQMLSEANCFCKSMTWF